MLEIESTAIFRNFGARALCDLVLMNERTPGLLSKQRNSAPGVMSTEKSR